MIGTGTKIYQFEWESETCPCDIEMDLPKGFELRGTKNSDGLFESPPSLHITEDIEAGEYSLPFVLVDKNGFRSDNPTFADTNAEYNISPIHIIPDSFTAVKMFVPELHVGFYSMSLCEGGCDTTNNFIKLDDDGVNNINEDFVLTRNEGLSNDSEIVWTYTGLNGLVTYDKSIENPISKAGEECVGVNCTGSGVKGLIYYERNFSNEDNPTGLADDPDDDCACGGENLAGVPSVVVKLTKNACADQSDPTLLGDWLEISYDGRGCDISGDIFWNRRCEGDPYGFLDGSYVPNSYVDCNVTGEACVDKRVAYGGECWIHSDTCGAQERNVVLITPSPYPSCTVTITPTSTETATASVSSTASPTSTLSPSVSPTETVPASDTATSTPSPTHTVELTPTVTPTVTSTGPIAGAGLTGIMLSVSECGGAPDDFTTLSDLNVISILLETGNFVRPGYKSIVGDEVLKIFGTCYEGEPISSFRQWWDIMPVETDQDGRPFYSTAFNYPRGAPARAGQYLNQEDQSLWDALISTTVYSSLTAADPDWASFSSCSDCQITESASATSSPTLSATASPTDSLTESPSATQSPTSSQTATASTTQSPTATATQSSTATSSPSPSVTATASATPTATGICSQCIEVKGTSSYGNDGDGLYEQEGTHNGKPFWKSKHSWTADSNGHIYWCSSASRWRLTGTLGTSSFCGGSTGLGVILESTDGDAACPSDATWKAFDMSSGWVNIGSALTDRPDCTTTTASATATASMTEAPSATTTPTVPYATDSPTVTLTSTATASQSATATASLSATPSLSPTSTASQSATATASLSPTPTASLSPTATATLPYSDTGTPSATPSLSHTATATPTADPKTDV